MSCRWNSVAAPVAICGGLAIGADAHAQWIVTGPDVTGGPNVHKYFEPGGQTLAAFFAFSSSFTLCSRAIGRVDCFSR